MTSCVRACLLGAASRECMIFALYVQAHAFMNVHGHAHASLSDINFLAWHLPRFANAYVSRSLPTTRTRMVHWRKEFGVALSAAAYALHASKSCLFTVHNRDNDPHKLLCKRHTRLTAVSCAIQPKGVMLCMAASLQAALACLQCACMLACLPAWHITRLHV